MLALTGGFRVHLGSLAISSCKPLTPLLVAVAGLIAATVISRLIGAPPPWVALLARVRRWLALLRVHARTLWVHARMVWIGARSRWIHARVHVPAAMPIAFVIAAAVLDLHQLFGAAPLWVDEEMIALNLRDRFLWSARLGSDVGGSDAGAMVDPARAARTIGGSRWRVSLTDRYAEGAILFFTPFYGFTRVLDHEVSAESAFKRGPERRAQDDPEADVM